MVKKYSLLILALLFSVVFQAGVYAQDVANPQPTTIETIVTPECPNVVFMCLDTQRLCVDDPANPNANAGQNCLQNRRLKNGFTANDYMAARLRFSATGIPATDATGDPTKVYIACGYNDPSKGRLLTTGNPTADRELCIGNQDTYKYMTRTITSVDGQQIYPTFNYAMELLGGKSNPLTPVDGKVSGEVISASGPTYEHGCFAAYTIDTQTVGSDPNDPSKVGDSSGANSLQYATFITDSAPAQCASVKVDPYGRVFNENLKPVPQVGVTLFESATKKKLSEIGVTNPFSTYINGLFNFNIEPNTVYLETNLPQNTNVHPNATLAYSNIYTYGDPIIEKLGKKEQRDIPVIGGAKPVLSLMGYAQMQLGSRTSIEAQASWPLTIIELMQGSVTIAQQQSDNYGHAAFFVDNKDIDPSQEITMKLTEVDLTVDPNSPASNPETVEKTFDPIPTYLEGYAYDAQGNILPFAQVRVVMDASGIVFYETQADANAYYSILTRHLPVLPYHIEYVKSNQAAVGGNIIKVRVPEFAEKNKEYLVSEDIDIMKGTKKGEKVDPGAFLDRSETRVVGQNPNGEDGQLGFGGNSSNSPERQSGTSTATTQQQNTLLILLLIVVFTIVGIATYFIRKYMRKTSTETSGRYEKMGMDDDEELLD